MDCTDLQHLSKDELIELVIQLQRPDKTSRNSSKPPSTDKKEKRGNSRPGGAKPGHEPHNRRLADNPDDFRDHRPTHYKLCGGSVSPDADMELIGEYDEIEMPPVKPHMGSFGSRGELHSRIRKPPVVVSASKVRARLHDLVVAHQINLTFGRRSRRQHQDPALRRAGLGLTRPIYEAAFEAMA